MTEVPPKTARPGLLAALVLAFAGTWTAIVFALLCLCLYAGTPLLLAYCVAGLVAGPTAAVAAWTRTPRRRRRARILLVPFALLLVAIVAPWPGGARASLVEDRALPGHRGGAPWFGGIPEDELVRLGAWVMSTPHERESTVRAGFFDRHYAEVAEGDTLPNTSSRVLDTWVFDRGHYWLAVPEGPGPFPLLVFLHGNAGPFQFYPQSLAWAVVGSGYAVAFPSFGFGHWDREAGYRRVDAVVQAVQAELPIDPERVVIGGLSAGGMGALGALVAAPERFQACLVLSGVPGDVPAEPFVARPLLVIHGDADERVRVGPARDLVERVAAAGGAPRYVEHADADHFLLLTHQDAVLAEVRRWLLELGER